MIKPCTSCRFCSSSAHCLRYPPTVVEPGRQGEARYPYVMANQGCGEHRWRDGWWTRTWATLKTNAIDGFYEIKKLAQALR